MHWFESQLAALDQLASDYLSARQAAGNNIVSMSEAIRIKRGRFTDAVQRLVDSVIKVAGVTGCAAYHDGLILANAGALPNTDALGAMIQESLNAANLSSSALRLGDIQQIVIVGDSNKIALLSVGPIVLCITSPKDVNLALALRQPID